MADGLRCPACGSKRLRYHQVRVFSMESSVLLKHNAGGHPMLMPGRTLHSNKDQHDHAEGDDQILCLACDGRFSADDPAPFRTRGKPEDE